MGLVVLIMIPAVLMIPVGVLGLIWGLVQALILKGKVRVWVWIVSGGLTVVGVASLMYLFGVFK